MNTSRYNYIQVLRFLAAFFIVLYHCGVYLIIEGKVKNDLSNFFSNSIFSSGVILFFVISGFVITHSTFSKPISVKKFLIHRLIRIYLPFLIAVLGVLIIKLLIFGSVPIDNNFLATLTLFPFGQLTYNLSIEWSLIYEVFFYLIFALLLFFKSQKVVLYFSIFWFITIILFMYLKPGWATSLLQPNFFIMFFSAYNLAFILGIFAYFIHREVIRKFIALVPFILLLFFLLGMGEKRSDIKILFLGLSFFILISSLAHIALYKDVKNSSLFVQYGNASYGLYLIHVPIITILISKFIIPNDIPANIAFFLIATIGLSGGLLFGMLEVKLYQLIKSKIDKGFKIQPFLFRSKILLSLDKLKYRLQKSA